ncbi:hypothetical protein ZIOFF_025737 [Zingiber officinale]|uniref:Uncharacterized protein n=1 Tax=Zingiber officinale TaxID=94328 RepID=A0A8J5H425_ZINOF|nr:hypothetical protein ZIOFF_025737 [Zingiber officinale]
MLGSKLGQQAAAVLPPKGPNFAAKGEDLERGGRNVGHGYDVDSLLNSDGDPWEHALGMGIGVVFANQMVKWEKKLKEDLDKIVEKALDIQRTQILK